MEKVQKKNPKRKNEVSLINKVPGYVKRPIKYISDVEMTFQPMNCRSLKFKLKSLAENFMINKCSFILPLKHGLSVLILS